MVKDFFFLAMRIVLRRRLRSWLTVIGIVIGVTAVVAPLSLGLGLEQTIIAYMGRIFEGNTIMIMGGDEEVAPAPQLLDFDPDLVRQVEGVDAIAPIRTEKGEIAKGEPPVSERLVVVGLCPEMVTEFRWFIGEFPVAEGRMLLAGDEHKAIIGYAVAERLGATPGATIEIEGQSFEIVGILETDPEAIKATMGFIALELVFTDESIFIPFAMMEEVFEDTGAPLILVKAEEGQETGIVAERIKEALAEAGIADILLRTLEGIAEGIREGVRIVSAFVAGLVGIALLVGAVGVMNTMYTSVLEQTREIGVMKAVGAQNGHILLLFLIESSLIGLVGGIIGVVFGLLLSTGASLAVRHFLGLELLIAINPWLIGGALLFPLLIGAFAGMLPAWRASKLRPLEAFRYE